MEDIWQWLYCKIRIYSNSCLDIFGREKSSREKGRRFPGMKKVERPEALEMRGLWSFWDQIAKEWRTISFPVFSSSRGGGRGNKTDQNPRGCRSSISNTTMQKASVVNSELKSTLLQRWNYLSFKKQPRKLTMGTFNFYWIQAHCRGWEQRSNLLICGAQLRQKRAIPPTVEWNPLHASFITFLFIVRTAFPEVLTMLPLLLCKRECKIFSSASNYKNFPKIFVSKKILKKIKNKNIPYKYQIIFDSATSGTKSYL